MDANTYARANTVQTMTTRKRRTPTPAAPDRRRVGAIDSMSFDELFDEMRETITGARNGKLYDRKRFGQVYAELNRCMEALTSPAPATEGKE